MIVLEGIIREKYIGTNNERYNGIKSKIFF